MAATKSPVYATYPLTYRQNFNGRPYEARAAAVVWGSSAVQGHGPGRAWCVGGSADGGGDTAAASSLDLPFLTLLAPLPPTKSPQEVIKGTVASPWGSACAAGELDMFPTCGWAKDASYPNGIPCVGGRAGGRAGIPRSLQTTLPPLIAPAPAAPGCLLPSRLPSCVQVLSRFLLHLRRPHRL